MKDPVPAEQASFMAASTTRPPSRRMNLASWPPISKMVSTRSSQATAPAAWAAISFSTHTLPAPKHTDSREPTISRPEPVTPQPRRGRAAAGLARNARIRAWAACTGAPSVSR